MKVLAFYNAKGIGDVLLLISGSALEDHLISETKGPVTLIKDRTTDQIVGCNIDQISQHFIPEGQGQVFLTEDQVEQVNQLIKTAGFELTVEVDNSPKFVVGYVEECVDHEDSDHLHITQTRVSPDQVLQIVCGAANIRQGLHVLVAQVGAVMPSGMIIWPGELRGVPSHGMICSTRELGLDHLNTQPGIWELDADFVPGTSLDQVLAKLS